MPPRKLAETDAQIQALRHHVLAQCVAITSSIDTPKGRSREMGGVSPSEDTGLCDESALPESRSAEVGRSRPRAAGG
jgi:hypothetical protein